MTKRKTKGWKQWEFVSDLHVGANTGLTCTPTNPIQTALLERWAEARQAHGKPHVLACVGDCIDGLDKKSRDIDENFMIDQAEKAAELLYQWGATDEYIIIAGTKYHVASDGEPMEKHVCKCLEYLIERDRGTAKVSYTRKLNTDVNGWFRVEARHHVGRSSVAHGRATSSLRRKGWGVQNAALASNRTGEPAAWPHLQVSAHVHYFIFMKDAWGAACVLPCWNALGSDYGDTICEGHVDIGALRVDISTKEEQTWRYEEILFPAAVVQRMEHR